MKIARIIALQRSGGDWQRAWGRQAKALPK